METKGPIEVGLEGAHYAVDHGLEELRPHAGSSRRRHFEVEKHAKRRLVYGRRAMRLRGGVVHRHPCLSQSVGRLEGSELRAARTALGKLRAPS